MKKYRILSPDGFDIEMDKTYTEAEIPKAFEDFKERFKAQGYYSNSNREKIPLEDIQDLCRVIDTKRDLEDLLEEEGEYTECAEQYWSEDNDIIDYDLFKAKYDLVETGADADAIDAYIDLGTGDDDLSSFEESYIGKYNSDEDFAREMANETCSVDLKNLPWPQNCIDWEFAAKELMYDYSESNGYYFRNI